ncbi:hypothetical protein B0H14DRAFT_2556581 [Mycena olivaceomarginata]|nr:hypothetical protein B0H14DRAFT_2556581 [Mycena olivaceomarginata]
MCFEVEKSTFPKKEILRSRVHVLRISFSSFRLTTATFCTLWHPNCVETHPTNAKLKSKARAKNLGAFAVKQSDDKQPGKRLRDTSPDPGARSAEESSQCSDAEVEASELNSANDSESSSEDECNGIEVHEKNDIQHPNDYPDLIKWLKLTDEHLASIHTSAQPTQRGSYHSTKVGKKLSVRRDLELRKAERERSEREDREDARHGLKKIACSPGTSGGGPDEQSSESCHMEVDEDIQILDEEPTHNLVHTPIFDRPSTPDPVPSTSPASGPSSLPVASQVTIEDVENDDDDVYLSVEALQLSPEALAEEGLDELPWDPSEDTFPCPADSPPPSERLPLPSPPSAPAVSPARSLPPGAASYFPGEQGFTMPNRPQRWKMPSKKQQTSDTGWIWEAIFLTQ